MFVDTIITVAYLLLQTKLTYLKACEDTQNNQINEMMKNLRQFAMLMNLKLVQREYIPFFAAPITFLKSCLPERRPTYIDDVSR